jgi:hypothetical protein
MRENCTSGSVQGAPGNRRFYCASQTSNTFFGPLVADAHAGICKTSCLDYLHDFSNLAYHNILDWQLGLDLARLALDPNAQIDFSVSYWQGPRHNSCGTILRSHARLAVCHIRIITRW